MKLSFSIPSSKSSSKQNPNIIKNSNAVHGSNNDNGQDSDSKEYLTEFDSSNSRSKNVKTVIPPLQNSNDWRLRYMNRMKNLTLPLTDSSNRDDSTAQLPFELDTSSNVDNDPSLHMSYGLNLRQTTTTNGGDDDGKDSKNIHEVDGSQNGSTEAFLLKKLKDDIHRLPEHKGLEEYEDVPVEGFGAAILAGYGWYEGRGIGKNAQEDVKVKQFEKRTSKEGLGFVADSSNVVGVVRKDKERPKELQIRDGFSVGKSVRIVAGRDIGLKGRILERVGNDWVVLKLSKSEERVKARVDDIAELGSTQDERCLKELKKIQCSGEDIGSSKRKRSVIDEGRRDRIDEVEEERKIDRNGDGSRKMEEKGQKRKQIPWLTSHIRVRIISKDFKGGRFYLKKGKVLDVVDPTTCDVSMDDSKEILQGVSQEFLETAIPRRGGPVLVLYGKYKGVYGSLVERDLDREVGVVRDADSHELLNVHLEQMAEYIGEPSYLGY